MFKEFKEFISRGGVFEGAVALIMALAFVPVVNAIIEGILMPIIAAVVGQPNYDQIVIGIGKAELAVGTVLTALVSFVSVAFVVFLMVKAYNRMTGKVEEEAGPSDNDLLVEIRDLLSKK